GAFNITVSINLLIPAVVFELLAQDDPVILVELDGIPALEIKEVTAEDPEGASTPPPAIPSGTYYTVTVAGGITGGTLSASPKSGEAGAEISLAAAADSGYRLKAGTLKYNDGLGDTPVDESTKKFTLSAYNVTVSAQFENLPGLVHSAGDLAKIGTPGYPLNGDYELTANIALSNWMPIGAVTQQPFTGKFNGNGKTITINGDFASEAKNMEFNIPGLSEITVPLGLFWCGSSAEIRNFALVLNMGAEGAPLNLSGTSAATSIMAGGAVGWAEQTSLRDITVSGQFITSSTTESFIGGIVGGSIDGETVISGCTSSLKIASTAVDGGIGGIAGTFCGGENAVIENCHTTGAINLSGTSRGEIGGLVGHFEASVINCSAAGDISVVTTAGGVSVGGIAGSLSGESHNGSIINSFATGNMSVSTTGGGSRAGGIAGTVRYDSGHTVILRNCSATGNVSAGGEAGNEVDAGGLVGSQSDHGGSVTIEYCYAAGDVSVTGGTTLAAGGIVAFQSTFSGGTYIIRACAALNQNISGSSGGRIAGFSSGGTLQDNIAYNNMQVNSATVSAGNADTHDGINGLSKTSSDLTDKATYQALDWDFTNVWKMEGSPARPVLK
ncbi:MAG: hypothetical protein LBK13_08125, partial [Spirochaetales bacterium]|nr:hypothetical protein [Spirochaetales bacterium]